MTSKVSVIIPYYKKLDYFKKALSSVLNQSYKNIEILIIYDDEEKNDLFKIKKIIHKNKKIKLIINNKNYGVGISRNKGIKHSSGNYLSFLDADDIWKLNKLKYQINYMKKNNLEFTHTNYKIIDLNDKVLGNINIKKNLDYKALIRSCDIGLSTVILKKKILKNLKFNNFKTKEDYSLWLKIAKKKN
jgi:teichuronic acid biosynthesis glycosyltransferase TuaG